MKARVLICFLVLLLLAGCTAAPEPAADSTGLPSDRSPEPAFTAAPSEPPVTTAAPVTEDGTGLTGTVMQVPESVIVLAAEPEAEIPVDFPRTDLTDAPGGRLCRLELYVDNLLEQSVDPFVLKPEAGVRFTVAYDFTRFMDRDGSLIRVELHYGEETLTQEIPVTLINYPDEVYAARSGDRLPYSVDIIRNHCEVVVYAKDSSGAYTLPVKVFVCSPGYATPLGTFYLSVKNRWQPLFGGVYGQYGTRITGNVLFHSVPYYEARQDRLKTGEYNRLGSICSMGCVRLSTRDAKWIYDFCPVGTPVNIYDANYAPFERPEPIRLDPEDPNSCWDPTDPSVNNPWNPLYEPLPEPPKPGTPEPL